MLADVTFALRRATPCCCGPQRRRQVQPAAAARGFLAPAAGTLWWEGKPAFEDRAEHRARLHLIGHSNAIKGALTVRENLGFAAAVAGTPAAQLAGALEGFELTALADVPAAYLSAGQQRRLALARLLATPRPLWLLDEPDAGLDAANRAHLARAVARVPRQGDRGHRDPRRSRGGSAAGSGARGLSAAFAAIVRRDLQLGLRRSADSLQPLFFFVIASHCSRSGSARRRRCSSASGSA